MLNLEIYAKKIENNDIKTSYSPKDRTLDHGFGKWEKFGEAFIFRFSKIPERFILASLKNTLKNSSLAQIRNVSHLISYFYLDIPKSV